MKEFIKKVRKALVAFAVPFAGELVRVQADGLTAAEIGAAAGIGVAAALLVFGVKNAPWKASQ